MASATGLLDCSSSAATGASDAVKGGDSFVSGPAVVWSAGARNSDRLRRVKGVSRESLICCRSASFLSRAKCESTRTRSATDSVIESLTSARPIRERTHSCKLVSRPTTTSNARAGAARFRSSKPRDMSSRPSRASGGAVADAAACTRKRYVIQRANAR